MYRNDGYGTAPKVEEQRKTSKKSFGFYICAVTISILIVVLWTIMVYLLCLMIHEQSKKASTPPQHSGHEDPPPEDKTPEVYRERSETPPLSDEEVEDTCSEIHVGTASVRRRARRRRDNSVHVNVTTPQSTARDFSSYFWPSRPHRETIHVVHTPTYIPPVQSYCPPTQQSATPPPRPRSPEAPRAASTGWGGGSSYSKSGSSSYTGWAGTSTRGKVTSVGCAGTSTR